MPDITEELAAIQVATTGSQIRSAIINALSVVNSYIPSEYSGSYVIAPSTVSQILSTSNVVLRNDLTIEAFPVYDASYTVAPSTASISLLTSGLAMTSNLTVEAFPVYSGPYVINPSTSSIILSVSDLAMTSDLTIEAFPVASLISKTITSNGVYSASDDNVDGYSEVTVSVETYEVYKSIFDKTISYISMSELTSINFGAFYSESLLTEVHLPNVTAIGSYAFARCGLLMTVDAPNLREIWASAFNSCYALSSVSFPSLIYVGANAFRSCTNLETVNIESATTIAGFAFGQCERLLEINAPECTMVSSSAFYSAYSLSIASLPKVETIQNSAFCACRRLISLYLMGSSVCNLTNVNAFAYGPISNSSSYAGRYGSIFVPASLYSEYIAATNWSAYAARFVSVE